MDSVFLADDRLHKLIEFEKIIGYKFNDILLLNKALTHRSYANEHKKSKIKDNERLEFLGDAVLSLVITEYIFNEFQNKREGELAKIRSSVVSSKALFKKSKELNLGEYILLGKGEESTGGRKRFSNLTNVYEAVIGAIFIDSDFASAKIFILEQFKQDINEVVEKRIYLDYKSILQEYTQHQYKVRPIYKLIKEEGPEHSKKFTVEVFIEDKSFGSGTSNTKKEAEQLSAEVASKKLKILDEG